MKADEFWRPIPGYEGLYLVSNFGRIKSVDRYHNTNNRFGSIVRKLSGKLKTLSLAPDGYFTVRLCKHGRAKTFRVNRVVAETFLGSPNSSKLEACHKNNCKTDNNVNNLYWGTRIDNEQDKTKSFRRNPAVKISISQVELARKMRADGNKLREISKVLGCSIQNVSYIVNKVTRNVY